MDGVGSSFRSPLKYAALRAVMAEETRRFIERAEKRLTTIQIFLDCHSGHTIVEKNPRGGWWRNHTGAMAIHYAMEIANAGFESEVRLFEIKKSTRDALIAELAAPSRLKMLGWEQEGDSWWYYAPHSGGVAMITVYGDSDRPHHGLAPREDEDKMPMVPSVFVCQDPNNFVKEWSMSDEVFAALEQARFLTTTHWILFGGRSRIGGNETLKARWVEQVRLLTRLSDLPYTEQREMHEILLVRVNGNGDRGYMTTFWMTCHRDLLAATEADIITAMEAADPRLSVSSYVRSRDREEFDQQVRELTMTKAQQMSTPPRVRSIPRQNGELEV